ncbi:hypothetical protein V8F20_005408 [Naviculisporaceae sp. PSN 640]
MASSIEGIADTGFTVVHSPDDGDGPPVVDIVIVHGLQGHPFTTWASPQPKLKANEVTRKSILDKLSGRIRRNSGRTSSLSFIFWPRDMLPSSCPRSRILVYGYDSKVTRYLSAGTNKNNIFSHARDLLSALSRKRELGRRLVFIAHSLGGIVVKEMLAQSSTSTDHSHKNIVDSTSSVIFLGTPHRGSPDLAAMGEWARSFVGSALRMATNDAILNALNLKTSDLQRAQESFSRIWHKHDFRVKTFQEGLGLTGVNLSLLGKKVVPDESSAIGDHRERAETIQANHMEMCRFTGPLDPNYAKLLGEILEVYRAVVRLNEQDAHLRGHSSRAEQNVVPGLAPWRHEPGEPKRPALRADEILALRTLRYPSMHDRAHSLRLEKPALQTCQWLFEHQEYQLWLLNRDQAKRCGMIWLKGKPGAGKSTLVHEAFRRAERESGTENLIAAFFFNAKGGELEHSAQGLYRSLLHQLLPHHPPHLRRLVDLLSVKEEYMDAEEERPALAELELKDLLSSLLHENTRRRTVIYIDALDECDVDSVRPLAYFWRDITKAIPNLSVCISSRHYPSVTLVNCPDIVVDKSNNDDIATYVDQRLGLSINDNEPEKEIIKSRILDKAAGVFLWVTLVVDDILRKRDEGKSLKVLLNELDELPSELEALFSSILETVEPDRYQDTKRLFQWAILATRPLRIYEWQHVLGFMVKPPPLSLWIWRVGQGDVDSRKVNIIEVERRIKTLSRGLLEVRMSETEDLVTEAGHSIDAGAGSLESGHGENGVIEVIHESVREFFLKSGGLSVLGGISVAQDFIADGHLAIMDTSLDYINVAELDGLIKARTEPVMLLSSVQQEKLPSSFREAEAKDHGAARSVHSFGSAHSYNNSHTNSLSHTTIRQAENPRRNSSENLTDNAAPNRAAPEEQRNMFEMLKKSMDEAWNRDYFAQRMELYQITTDEISINPSIVSQSVAGATRVLEDYPGLLSYAVFELFTHACLAQNSGADPTAIINRFRERESRLWIRWLALAEDLPISTSLFFHAAKNGLLSWMVAMDQCETSRHRAVCAKHTLSSVLGLLSGDSNGQDGNRASPSGILEGMFTTLAEVYDALTCDCDSCSVLFRAMIEAAKRRDVEVLECLAQHSQIGTLYRDSNDDTILHILARIPDPSLLRGYLRNTLTFAERGVGDLCALPFGAKGRVYQSSGRNYGGETALHVAVSKENVENVSELLKNGFLPHVMDSVYGGPLHLACAKRNRVAFHDISENNVKIASLLLKAGAKVNAIDRDSDTPLHYACLDIPNPRPPGAEDATAAPTTGGASPGTSPNIIKLVELLLSHGAKVSSVSAVGATPLHTACGWRASWGDASWRDSCPNTLAIVTMLLDANADVRARIVNDETPLHNAAASSSREVAAELIRRGAPIMARDRSFRTPLHHAALTGNNPVVEEILASDKFDPKEIDTVDNTGLTPLGLACQIYNQQGNTENKERGLKLVRNLLEHGAQVHGPKDKRGLTPFGIAQQRRLYDVSLLLREFGGDPPINEAEKTWAGLGEFGKGETGKA